MLREDDKRLIKVLVIENDKFNICVMDSFLYACGYSNVVIARNEKEALKQFTSDTGFILLNTALPDSSGFELCKRLRETSKEKIVPIIALVQKGKNLRARCFKAGANSVMSTPTSFKGFENIIQRSMG